MQNKPAVFCNYQLLLHNDKKTKVTHLFESGSNNSLSFLGCLPDT